MEMAGPNMVKYGLSARLQENGLTDLHKNFTIDSSRVKDELIRFWPYMVMFHGNGRAKYIVKSVVFGLYVLSC